MRWVCGMWPCKEQDRLVNVEVEEEEEEKERIRNFKVDDVVRFNGSIVWMLLQPASEEIGGI